MGSVDYIRHGTKRKLLRGEHVHWVWYQQQRNGRDYVRNCVLSAPLWILRTDFYGLERERDRLEVASGLIHELDHITPVSHPLVSGLTVPWNMNPVPRWINGRKGNSWHNGDQTPLFPELDLDREVEINWQELYRYLSSRNLTSSIDATNFSR